MACLRRELGKGIGVCVSVFYFPRRPPFELRAIVSYPNEIYRPARISK
jgi:hypothetical protein